MSYNTFGRLFRITTWGESHGPAIGCIIDGCPPNLNLCDADIQPWLDKRKPGQSIFTTQRQEDDKVRILSGVFNGKTTGTPISLIIENKDHRSTDYSDIANRYRPGHADIAYDMKYGIRDYRGGGRSSARETAMRVAAGAVGRIILDSIFGKDLKIRGALSAIGDLKIDEDNWNWDEVSANPFNCPDAKMVPLWEKKLLEVRKSGSSIGAIVDVIAEGIPCGLGAPIYAKLDSDLASAMMSINGVKGVEIGDGFGVSSLRGEENADPISWKEKNQINFQSNHAGGILGGISSGQPLRVKLAVKPTSSILVEVNSITKDGKNVKVKTKGRHDPCIGIRAVPVAEAMMVCVLVDQCMMHMAQCGLSIDNFKFSLN